MNASFSGTRIWAIAHNVFRETIRDKILYLILLFIAIMGAAVLLVPQVANTAEVPVILNIGLASMNLIGLVVACFIGAGLMNKEVDKRTMYLLVAKPLSRAELITGKHLGMTVLLSALQAVMFVIFLGLVATLDAEIPFAALSVATLFMFLELCLVVGIAILFGVITSSILATILTLALYLMGHLSPVLLQFASGFDNPVLSSLLKGLFLTMPNLERLNLKNDAIYAQLPQVGDMLASALYGVVYIVVLLTLASAIFSRKQF